MAFTSYGYEGSVAEVGWARLHYDAGGSYGNHGSGSNWRVTVDNTGDRKVSISAGAGSGKGVTDITDEAETLTLGSVGAGSRWDMIVVRRDWDSNTSSFAVIVGSALKQLPTRNSGFGTLDDQPIALCRVEAGKTAVQEIVDLRCWKAGGGLVAMDPLALGYLANVGTQVTIKGITWQYVLSASYVASWVQVTSDAGLTLLAAGTSISGGVMPVSARPLIQGGTLVQSTDAAGYARVTFPAPFPNGLLSVVLTSGDSSVDRATAGDPVTYGVAGLPWDTGNRTGIVYAAMRSRSWGTGLNIGNFHHRINWIAVGW